MTTRPLVPVLKRRTAVNVSLEDAFTHADSLALQGSNPLIELAYLRLLTTIVQHALRPSHEDVRRFLEKGLPRPDMEHYLQKYGFDMFDKHRPLMQIRRLEGDAPWYRLAPGRNGASSTTVTDHSLYHAPEPISHTELFTYLLTRLTFPGDTGNSSNGYIEHGTLVKKLVLYNRETTLLKAICAHLPAPDLPPVWTLDIPSAAALDKVDPAAVSPYTQLSRAVRLKRSGRVAYAKGMGKLESDPMALPFVESFASHTPYRMLETLASPKTKIPPFFRTPHPRPVLLQLDVHQALHNTVHHIALPCYDRLELRRLVGESEKAIRRSWVAANSRDENPTGKTGEYNRAALEARAAFLIQKALGSTGYRDVGSDLMVFSAGLHRAEGPPPPVRPGPDPLDYVFVRYLRNLDDQVIARFRHLPDSPDFPSRYIRGFLGTDTTPDERRPYLFTAHFYGLSVGAEPKGVTLLDTTNWDTAVHRLRNYVDLSTMNWVELNFYLRHFPFASSETLWRTQ